MAKLNDSSSLDAICAKLKDSHVPGTTAPHGEISPTQDAGVTSQNGHTMDQHSSTTPALVEKHGQHSGRVSPLRIPKFDSNKMDDLKNHFESRNTLSNNSGGAIDMMMKIKSDTNKSEYLSTSYNDSFNRSSSSENYPFSGSMSFSFSSSNGTTSVGGSTNGRKSRRKNTAPKNLHQLRDSNDGSNATTTRSVSREDGLLMYQDGAKTMEDPSMIDSETEDENFLRQADLNKSKGSGEPDLLDSGLGSSYEGVLDLSCSKPRTASSASAEDLYHVDDCGALDLSSGNSSVPTSAPNNKRVVVCLGKEDTTKPTTLRGGPINSQALRTLAPMKHHDDNKVYLSGRSKFSRDVKGTGVLPSGGLAALNSDQEHSDATVMKDYAESTFNEVLNMYGLDGEDASTVTEAISLQRFATGNILNTCDNIKDGELKPEEQKVTEGHHRHLRLPSETEELSKYRENSATPNQEETMGLIESLGNQSDGLSESNSSGSKIGALYSPLKTSTLPDYGKYVRRYQSSEDCGSPQCAELQYREHFHCVDCTYKVFLKKEEMIRHFKWHRKRDESLQHGFLRYSPIDDCSKRFSGCIHNGRQTHYHCVQPGCSKVYISTSDVQMHSNYHRKDSAIIQLGFQRFRATEDCRVDGCPFYGQRTTHFHCRKPGCHFSFKNKADIEKHKSYHQKDEVLAKDGFKKFMKYETCHFQGCRFSNLANHIHCIRPGCDYILHSTSQLLSHKRKHERREIEFAYRRFKDTNTSQTAMLNPALLGFASNGQAAAADNSGNKSDNDEQFEGRPESPTFNDLSDSNSLDAESFSKSTGATLSQFEHFDPEPGPFSRSLPSQPVGLSLGTKMDDDRIQNYQPTNLGDSVNSTSTTGDSQIGSEDMELRSESPQNSASKVSPPINDKRERDETWKKYITRYTANDPCNSRCQLLYKDHYHCNAPTCGILFKSKDGVREHARHHDHLERITELSYMTYQAGTSCVEGCQLNKQKHYHCLWTECQYVISESEPVFRRLEHFQVHELSRTSGKRLGISVVRANQDLKRRRGRPPKYPKIDIPVVPKIEMSEENIAAEVERYGANHPIAFGYKKFIAGTPCPDDKCIYFLKDHFHCVRQRCHHATDNKEVLNLHAKDFHSYITIHKGFEFFDRTINCRRPHCHNNKANRHFHCVRSKCDYSFVRYSTMTQHDKKHKMAEMGLTPHPNIGIPSSSIVSQALAAVGAQVGSVSATSSALIFGPINKPVMLQTSPTSRTEASRSSITGQRLIAPKPVLSAPQVIVGVPVPFSSSTSVSTQDPAPTPAVSVHNTHFNENQSFNPIVIQPTNTIVEPVSSIVPPAHLVMAPQNDSRVSESLPLAGLLQQRGSNVTPQVNWETILGKMHFDVDQSCKHPFCKLKKKDHYHCIDCNQAFSDTVRIRNHMAKHGLKLDSYNKILGWHYMPQIQSIGPVNPDAVARSSEKVDVQSDGDSDVNNNYEEEEEDDDFDASSSLNLNPMVFTDMLQRSQNKAFDDDSSDLVMDLSDSINSADKATDQGQNVPAEHSERTKQRNTLPSDFGSIGGAFHSISRDKASTSSESSEVKMVRRSTRKRSATSVTRYDDYMDGSDLTAQDVRPPKMATSIGNALSDRHKDVANDAEDWSPEEGYQKYPSHADCGVPFCSFKTNTAHYHCVKNNCTFGTSETPRLAQHSDYHRKTELILGNEFTMFRVRQRCDSAMSCEYSGISTHYHCCKCPFVCTDLSKVTSHRRYHGKMEQIETQGFCKVAAPEDCGASDRCEYRGKQTHYHCMQGDCVYVATVPQQMLAHNKATHTAAKM